MICLWSLRSNCWGVIGLVSSTPAKSHNYLFVRQKVKKCTVQRIPTCADIGPTGISSVSSLTSRDTCRNTRVWRKLHSRSRSTPKYQIGFELDLCNMLAFISLIMIDTCFAFLPPKIEIKFIKHFVAFFPEPFRFGFFLPSLVHVTSTWTFLPFVRFVSTSSCWSWEPEDFLWWDV
jgi:hypothetical protein